MAGLKSINELFQAWLITQLSSGVQDGTLQPTPGSHVQNVYSVDSAWASAVLTAPGAATAIATTDLLTGLYEVQGQVMYAGSGTPLDAVDAANVAIYVGVLRKMRIMVPATKNVPYKIERTVFRFNNQPAQIATVLAGSANVDYWATVTATRIGA